MIVIMPQSLKAETEPEAPPNARPLLIGVGLDPLPVLRTLLELQPLEVLYLATEESVPFVETIVDAYRRLSASVSQPIETYLVATQKGAVEWHPNAELGDIPKASAPTELLAAAQASVARWDSTAWDAACVAGTPMMDIAIQESWHQQTKEAVSPDAAAGCVPQLWCLNRASDDLASVSGTVRALPDPHEYSADADLIAGLYGWTLSGEDIGATTNPVAVARALKAITKHPDCYDEPNQAAIPLWASLLASAAQTWAGNRPVPKARAGVLACRAVPDPKSSQKLPIDILIASGLTINAVTVGLFEATDRAQRTVRSHCAHCGETHRGNRWSPAVRPGTLKERAFMGERVAMLMGGVHADSTLIAPFADVNTIAAITADRGSDRVPQSAHKWARPTTFSVFGDSIDKKTGALDHELCEWVFGPPTRADTSDRHPLSPTTPQVTIPKAENTLVACVGYASTRTLRVIQAVGPSSLVLIHSPETRHRAKALSSLLKQRSDFRGLKISPVEVQSYDPQPLRSVHLPEEGDGRVHLDVSSGTSSMIASTYGWWRGLRPDLKAAVHAAPRDGGSIRVLGPSEPSGVGRPVSAYFWFASTKMLGELHEVEDVSVGMDTPSATTDADVQRILESLGRFMSTDEINIAAKKLESALRDRIETLLPDDFVVLAQVVCRLRTLNSRGREFECDIVVMRDLQIWVIEVKLGGLKPAGAFQALAEVVARARNVGGPDAHAALVCGQTDLGQLATFEGAPVAHEYPRPRVFGEADIFDVLDKNAASRIISWIVQTSQP
jgi:hypothetical protein